MPAYGFSHPGPCDRRPDGTNEYNGPVPTHDEYFDVPAVHPRLSEPALVSALAETWRAGHGLVIGDVLEPGLGAELAVFLGRLPLAASFDADEQGIFWRCSVGMPALDPQYPGCLFRLVRFLDVDLPALASAITGRALAPGKPAWIDVQVFRKGSYVDAGKSRAPASGVDFILDLTGVSWPAAWGGHMEHCDESGQVRDVRAPGSGTLHLLASARFQVPVVRRHVERLWVRGALAPLAQASMDGGA